MKCLSCNTEMTNNLVVTKRDQLSYDVCEQCGSLWLDHGELKKLAFQVYGDIEYCSTKDAAGVAEPPRRCPRCDDATLHKVFFIGYSDIILDYCHNCAGFWLDGGELDRINKELQRVMPVEGKGFSEFLENIHTP
ncbi:MAG: zf-TFIIB domain-containing protein [Phycisphaerae bacterium]|nr:zf-TFIIB domain-containing protein [Phycisphaerae bacterium]